MIGDKPYEIRAERADDFAERAMIAAVNAAAFDLPGHGPLPAALRATAFYRPDWSFVALADDRVVGHVMIGVTYLEGPDGRRLIPHLSPLAVDPSRQRQGIGSALVEAAVAAVDDAGEPFVVLEGSPDYYRRLGFEPAPRYGVTLPIPDWAPRDAGQLRKLSGYRPLTGAVVYPPPVRAAFEAIATV